MMKSTIVDFVGITAGDSGADVLLADPQSH